MDSGKDDQTPDVEITPAPTVRFGSLQRSHTYQPEPSQITEVVNKPSQKSKSQSIILVLGATLGQLSTVRLNVLRFCP